MVPGLRVLTVGIESLLEFECLEGEPDSELNLGAPSFLVLQERPNQGKFLSLKFLA